MKTKQEITSSNSVPGSVATSACGEEDSCHDEGCLDEVGFLFEGNRPTRRELFRWTLRADSDATTAQTRTVIVALECADEEPGAVQSGHYLWPAAELMSKYMVEHYAEFARPSQAHQHPFRPTSLVELGAGCALASLTALQVFQDSLQCIVITDHDPGTLDRARNNHESTLEAILDASSSEDDMLGAINNIASIAVELESLEWTDSSGVGVQRVQQHLYNHTVLTSSQHQLHNHGAIDMKFDLVIGTDVIYCMEVVRPLFQTASQLLLNGPQGKFWLTNSFRYDEATETEIDAVCQEVRLSRTTLQLLEDEDGEQKRIQEFQLIPVARSDA